MSNEAVAFHLSEMDKFENNGQWGSEEYNSHAVGAYNEMTGAQKEVLRQLLFKGPIWDGDIASKSARGDLFEWDLAVRVCFKGEQGYTAAKYRVYTIWKCVEEAQLKKLGIE